MKGKAYSARTSSRVQSVRGSLAMCMSLCRSCLLVLAACWFPSIPVISLAFAAGRGWRQSLEIKRMRYSDKKYQNDRPGCQPVGGKIVDGVLAAIAPWRCVLCLEKALGMDLCIGCLNDLPWLGRLCRCCARPLPADSKALCEACAPQADGPRVAGYLAALAYEYPVDRMVQALKYRQRLEYARVLGELLTIRVHEHMTTSPERLPHVLLPVPLHKWRHMQRGFNQAAEIARWVGSLRGMRVAAGLAMRTRPTLQQAGLNRSARQANVRGAFRLTGAVADLRVALVDDVLTTGATTRELAGYLKVSQPTIVRKLKKHGLTSMPPA